MRRRQFLLSMALSFLLFASLVLSVKAEAIMWNRTYGGAANDGAGSLVATSDGGYAIVGSTASFGAGGSDVWLVKIDAFGNVEWNRTYGGAGDDAAHSLVVTSDGGYALAGITSSNGGDCWLVKTDASGNMEWNQTYGGTNVEWVDSLVETSDGGYVLVGPWNHSSSFIPEEFWIVKTDASGNMEWNQTYEEMAIKRSLVATSDGGYAIAGGKLLVKTNSTGHVEWNQTYGDLSYAYSLVATSDGGYALAGTYSGDGWLIKTDEYGNVEWNRTYGGTGSEMVWLLVATADGGYALAGFSGSVSDGNHDFWLVKTDAAGNMKWDQTYGGAGADESYSLVAASDGGYALAGFTASVGAGGQDFWVIKTDENGVAPEAAWVILPVLLTATLAIFISRKKLLRRHS